MADKKLLPPNVHEIRNVQDAAPNANYVLLIESDPRETELYSDIIREVSECKIDVVSRIGSSLDWIPSSSYHLIIIDVSSLDIRRNTSRNGALGILEKIKRVSPDTSVILISDKAEVEEAVAAIRLGAEDYLKKPFNLEKFKMAIRRGLDRKAVFGGNTEVAGLLHLLNSCQMVSASLEQSKIFSIVKSYFNKELSSNYGAVYSLHQDDPIRADDNVNEKTDRAMEEILDIAIYAASPFKSMIEENLTYKFIERGQLTPGLFVFRFSCAGADDYFCVSLSPRKPTDLEEFENQIHLFRRQIEVTGENIKQYMGVQHLVYVDDATGLYNTRYLNYVLDREISRVKKNNSEHDGFAVLFIDADKFKGINDAHGHLVGTRILNELGHHLKKYVRESDTLFRYGGDEFVAVLAPCDLETAKGVAERIRESVSKLKFLSKDGLDIQFTISIGVATFPQHAADKKTIIEMADKAMYGAKRKSRNRVVVVDRDILEQAKKSS